MISPKKLIARAVQKCVKCVNTLLNILFPATDRKKCDVISKIALQKPFKNQVDAMEISQRQ